MANPNSVEAICAQFAEQISATMAAIIKEFSAINTRTKPQPEYDRKILICGYNEDEDCLCLATDDTWSTYLDNRDYDEVGFAFEADGSSTVDNRGEQLIKDSNKGSVPTDEHQVVDTSPEQDDDKMMMNKSPEVGDHKDLLAKIEDPSSLVYQVCVEPIQDKVIFVSATDSSSHNLADDSTVVMAFCTNAKACSVADNVFDENSHRESNQLKQVTGENMEHVTKVFDKKLERGITNHQNGIKGDGVTIEEVFDPGGKMGGNELPGLVHLAMSNILSMCQSTGSVAEISYYEVYMDRCYDLLEPKAKEIVVWDDNDGQIHFKGLARVSINSMPEFHEAFSCAIQRRKVAHTGINDISSRSQGVLVVCVSTPCDDGSGNVVMGKLNPIDLAGNEDNKRTYYVDVRLQESAKINQSLFALSNVIYALNKKKSRVPYRESKLTRILQDSLGGRSRALMVACLNPGEFEIEFISADEDDESFNEYFSKMPWLAVPFSDSTIRDSLNNSFKVRGVPNLVLLDETGKVLTDDGDEESFKQGFEGAPWFSLPFKDNSCEKLVRYFELSSLPTLVILGPDGNTLHPNVAAAIEERGSLAYSFTPNVDVSPIVPVLQNFFDDALKATLTIATMEGSINEKLLRRVQTAEEGVDEEEKLKDRVWTESKKMWIVAGPAMFTRFSTFGVSVISQAFIGHIRATDLAAYALVQTVLLRFANGIMLGMASALETLWGQAYGAKQYNMLGVYLQRSWLILLLCSIFLLPVFIFTTPILIALGQEESIAKVTGTISLLLIHVVFSFIVSFTCQMFLEAQKFPNVYPLALCLVECLLAFDHQDRPSTEEALADPYFYGLANLDHEPSRQPIYKLEFEFERLIVMSAAVKHLTPVILELGGKCPTIFDPISDHSDLKRAAKRITGGKWGPCSGQACIGIDYILVEHKFLSTLIDILKKTIKRFYGENVKNLRNLSRIVNKHHFIRLRNLLEDPAVAASIVYGGSLNEENLVIEPTILLNPPLHAEIMEEEIFGPLLPLITLDIIEESIEFINSRPKPLAIYAFSKYETFKKQIAFPP